MLEVNNMAPGFVSVIQDNESISLVNYRGKKNVVLYFYPKDDTPGCTTEAIEFSGLINEFSKADTVVLGVSKDSGVKHQKFIKKHQLRVELLADTEGAVCELYETWALKKFMGRKFMGILRSTFVIDKQGKLTHVDYKVKAKGHAQAILDVVLTLE